MTPKQINILWQTLIVTVVLSLAGVVFWQFVTNQFPFSSLLALRAEDTKLAALLLRSQGRILYILFLFSWLVEIMIVFPFLYAGKRFLEKKYNITLPLQK
ncbi:MAG: hypothetical protein COU33_00145 [Candidatus Magasanikbacteria bacterium CG10_big_fil_rev_8_21_14_0_10_43_6]|uniref:Uncharacterized protein n=1 Tax=Candidatus Magasanikbacteria bacterium CG10_big_fil_rev_8_21_14_0_10_43_6 TaxID=1974650 RepID=A0A2M6W2F8_9BACT|nr:MAG: hypothetical protein COU33_00145 [Candidatus Magasanikbacteria bacterium CG10_big_fil_rev_8_21_14_0_10_43_6]